MEKKMRSLNFGFLFLIVALLSTAPASGQVVKATVGIDGMI